MKLRYTALADLKTKAAAIEAALMKQVTQVTYGGHTITYRSPAQMERALQTVYDSIDAMDPTNAPRRIRMKRSRPGGKGFA
ncbi:MAG: hypothetical protein Alpg2KO_00950 [Alphaproteobacteria bacterium]